MVSSSVGTDMRDSILESYGNFSGFRRVARKVLLKFVLSGSSYVMRVQSRSSPAKTSFFKIASVTGNHNFMIAFFPLFFFSFADDSFARQILILVAFGLCIGNWFKDYFCLPRPPPPVVKMVSNGSTEYGMPSTHSTTALSMSVYFLLHFVPMDSVKFVFGLLLCVLYVFVVSHSRIYLGMHSLADVLAGHLISFVTLYIWHFVGLANVCEDWLVHGGHYVPIVVFGIGIAFLLLQPEPVEYCTCFEDSACFMGSLCGVIVGSLQFRPGSYMKNFHWFPSIIRYVIAVLIMLLTRAIAKPTIKALVSALSSSWNSPSTIGNSEEKSYSNVASAAVNDGNLGDSPIEYNDGCHRRKIEQTALPIPKNGDIFNRRSIFEASIVVKFVAYSLMTYTASAYGPYVIIYLGFQ